jgi:AcrR family transcriptional regulator
MSTSRAGDRSRASAPHAAPRAGRPAQLSRQDVLTTALALADREGLAALTMRRLARELGCGVMTLYTYVRDRDDLLSGIVGLLTAEVVTDYVPGCSWQDHVRRGTASYRAMALRHPGAFPALALAPSDDPALQSHLRRLLDGMVAAGLEQTAARDLFVVLDSFGSGFLLMELSGPPDDEDASDELEPLDEAAFRRGVELVIAGAEAMLAPREAT